MKKFKITQNTEYLQGHLRMGCKEVEVEAENIEEAKEKAKGLLDHAEVIAYDWEIDDYEMLDELEVEELD